ncbi:unnamed protein product [Acanthoscelides obtectus]|uniref:Uncharacterized protein n=1 Tax=Acanthoscelides obtectus TaxID=200917 RepID=A0A9P0LY73_ACAOB|nr:unnamed protein product [Acanthoscelides obtectus]CAK1651521.1 hypothetical protein AOBTE_LOCUS17330 [Acanthoscelides obtectus]
MQARLLDGSPPGTQATCTPNSWTSGKVFLEQVRPTSDIKILLLLGTHESDKYYPARRSQLQDDVNMYAEDRPCTPMGSDTKKETHDNYAPTASPEPGCPMTYCSRSVLRPIPQPARPTTKRKQKLQRSN